MEGHACTGCDTLYNTNYSTHYLYHHFFFSFFTRALIFGVGMNRCWVWVKERNWRDFAYNFVSQEEKKGRLLPIHHKIPESRWSLKPYSSQTNKPNLKTEGKKEEERRATSSLMIKGNRGWGKKDTHRPARRRSSSAGQQEWSNETQVSLLLSQPEESSSAQAVYNETTSLFVFRTFCVFSWRW